jgi:hypothetical protein
MGEIFYLDYYLSIIYIIHINIHRDWLENSEVNKGELQAYSIPSD